MMSISMDFICLHGLKEPDDRTDDGRADAGNHPIGGNRIEDAHYAQVGEAPNTRGRVHNTRALNQARARLAR